MHLVAETKWIANNDEYDLKYVAKHKFKLKLHKTHYYFVHKIQIEYSKQIFFLPAKELTVLSFVYSWLNHWAHAQQTPRKCTKQSSIHFIGG